MPRPPARSRRRPACLIRPLVHALHAYVPGEQPKIPGLIKLNTNENPYPPSPQVLEAVRAAVDGRLRLYPDPTAEALRERLAAHHGCSPAQIIVGNGSDELLALATRAFVEPGVLGAGGGGGVKSGRGMRGRRGAGPESRVQYFTPSYSLYPVLADIHGAGRGPVPLRSDFTLPTVAELGGRGWEFEAALTYITTPNAPSGWGYRTQALNGLCRAQRGVVVLDEAYVDFAGEDALSLALEHPHVLVARTFSKAYSLCYQRVGYMVGHAALIAALHKIKDSYNVNGLGQVAALASLEDLPYYQAQFEAIRRTREQLAGGLRGLGFEVVPSQTNFLLCRPPGHPAEHWFAAWRERRILVRWFPGSTVSEFLRITVGTEEQAEALLAAARAILS